MNSITVEDIYKFYFNSNIEDFKVNDSQKDEVLSEKKFEEQSQFIKKYMKWYFSLNESSFLEKNVISKQIFLFRRVTLSQDYSRFIRLDFDRTLCVYNRNNPEMPILKIQGKMIDSHNLRFSFDSQNIAFYDENLKEINIWNIDQKEQFIIKEDNVDFMTFSKKGEYLGFINNDIIKIFHKNSVFAESREYKSASILDFAYESQNLVCISVENFIIIWDFVQNKEITKYVGEPESKINSIHFFHHDLKIIAGTSKKEILIWQITKKESNENEKLKKNTIIEEEPFQNPNPMKIGDHKEEVLSVLITNDEKFIYSYEITKNIPKIYVWILNGDSYEQHDSYCLDSDISSETISGDNFIISGYNYYIHSYNPKTKIQQHQKELIFGKIIHPIAFSSDNNLVAKSLNNNTINLFKTNSFLPLKQIKLNDNPTALAFSKDNSEIAVVFKTYFSTYNLTKGNEQKFDVMSNFTAICYLKDKRLITGNKEGDIFLLETDGKNLKQNILKKYHENQINVLSLNDDETHFASGDKKRVVIWDLLKKEKEQIIENDDEIINMKFFRKQPKFIVGYKKGNFMTGDLKNIEVKIMTMLLTLTYHMMKKKLQSVIQMEQ